jgi:hypothetical protein
MIKRPASLFRFARRERLGAIAQLGERVLCKHEVVGSIPTGSTSRTATATNAPHIVVHENRIRIRRVSR